MASSMPAINKHPGGARVTRESPRTIHQTRPRFGKSLRGLSIGSPSSVAIGTRVEKKWPLLSKLCCPTAKKNFCSECTTFHPFPFSSRTWLLAMLEASPDIFTESTGSAINHCCGVESGGSERSIRGVAIVPLRCQQLGAKRYQRHQDDASLEPPSSGFPSEREKRVIIISPLPSGTEAVLEGPLGIALPVRFLVGHCATRCWACASSGPRNEQG